jgi:aryl-alcohol dehydrogenase-like predicted oxidoreductase
MDAVYEHGCNTFDTAHIYGGGQSERVLGRWIAARGLRDQAVIITKGAHPMEGRNRVTPADITADLHESLERLGVDHIDIYMLHRDDPAVDVGPIVEILTEHHRAGKIGAFGGSNWSHARIQAAQQYAAEHGLVPFAFSSPNFSMAEQIKPPWDGCLSIAGRAGADARAYYHAAQLPLFTWSSLAGGFFSGRLNRANLDSFTEYLDKLAVEVYADDANFARLDRAEQLGKRRGLSIPQVAMAYVMSQPLNIFALVGCRDGAEFAANVAAMETTLTPDELRWLDLEIDALP